MEYQDCWAKTNSKNEPALMVWQHGINVGAVASALIETLPKKLSDIVPAGFTALAAAHDVGKISPHFQTLCKSWSETFGCKAPSRPVYHSVISQYTLDSFGVSEQLCEVVGYHHGSNDYHEKFDPSWKEQREKYLEDLERAIGEKLPKEKIKLSLPHKYFLCGLLVLADWVGSSEEFFPLDWQGSFSQAKRRVEEALLALRLIHQTPPQPFDFYHAFNFQPHKLQKEFLDFFKLHANPRGGVFVLRAPMGVGKTEASFAAAAIDRENGSRGIFFGLPTTLTSDRIFLRMEEFLSKIDENYPSLRRLHGKAIFYTEQNDSQASAFPAADWFGRSMKKGMIAPYGVGTIDQALLGVLAVKFFFLRLFSLAGKTVILDEVHSYDFYTSHLLKLLIEYLVELRCHVVITSATLTSRWLEKMFNVHSVEASYPSAHFFHGEKQFSTSLTGEKGNSVDIELKVMAEGSQDEFREQILDLAISTKANILWVCNTVEEAQRIFSHFKGANREDGPAIGLLHSRYLQRHRRSIEDVWIDRLSKKGERLPYGSILIGTQVVEQSLDIDVDYLVSELAPMDFLLQRAGRLWRHHKQRSTARPRMTITIFDTPSNILALDSPKSINEKLGPSAKVYCPYILLRTLSVLKDLSVLELPSDIQSLIESTYQERIEDQSALSDLSGKRNKREQKLAYLADVATKNESLRLKKDNEQAIVSTRYQDYDTLPLLVVDSGKDEQLIIDGEKISLKGKINSATQGKIQSREILVPAYRFENSTKLEIGYNLYILVETGGKDGWKKQFTDDALQLSYSVEFGLKMEKIENEFS